MNPVEMLKARMDSFHSKADAVLAIMQWLHDNDYAVCIFTPKELEATSLSADDVEAADKVYAQICDEIGVDLAEENQVSKGMD